MEFDNIDVSVPKKQGNLGVARAVYEYTRMGYTVLAPLSDSDKYDLVVDNGSQLLKVQVKTTRHKTKQYGDKKAVRTGYQVQLYTSGGNRRKHTAILRQDTDYDLLFVLAEDGSCWNIPASALTGITSMIHVGAQGNRAKYTEYKL